MTIRLDALLSVLTPTNILADIGCDHGKAGIAALKQGLAQQVVFSDISGESLNKAKKLAAQEGFHEPQVRFVHCDGCEGIEFADALLIAGMGGKEITKILRNCKFTPKQIILQPMRNQTELRQFLSGRFYTEIDRTVFDKKFYTVVKCSGGSEQPDEMQLAFGKTNLTELSDDFMLFVSQQTQKANRLSQNANCTEKWQRYLNLLESAKEKYDKKFEKISGSGRTN